MAHNNVPSTFRGASASTAALPSIQGLLASTSARLPPSAVPRSQESPDANTAGPDAPFRTRRRLPMVNSINAYTGAPNCIVGVLLTKLEMEMRAEMGARRLWSNDELDENPEPPEQVAAASSRPAGEHNARMSRLWDRLELDALRDIVRGKIARGLPIREALEQAVGDLAALGYSRSVASVRGIWYRRLAQEQ